MTALQTRKFKRLGILYEYRVFFLLFFPSFSFPYLQNSRYPAAIHPINKMILKNDVAGIIRRISIPTEMHNRAKPISLFMHTPICTVSDCYILCMTLQNHSKSFASSSTSAISSSVTLSSFLVVNLSRISGTISSSFVTVS